MIKYPLVLTLLIFIPFSEVPADKTVTYFHIISEISPQNPNPHCIHITVGGKLIDYPVNKSQLTATYEDATYEDFLLLV